MNEPRGLVLRRVEASFTSVSVRAIGFCDLDACERGKTERVRQHLPRYSSLSLRAFAPDQGRAVTLHSPD